MAGDRAELGALQVDGSGGGGGHGVWVARLRDGVDDDLDAGNGPRQIDDPERPAESCHSLEQLGAVARDHQYVDPVEQLVESGHQATREVRDALLDVLPVRTREAAGLDGRIVDLEVVPLPEQVLGDAHEGALT